MATNRDTIIKELGRFFKVAELVCDHTHAKWGEKAWQFLDTDSLHALLIIRRDILQAPLTCNHSGAHQRGLRCNRCELVREKAGVYLSSHILGKAGDFTIQGMSLAPWLVRATTDDISQTRHQAILLACADLAQHICEQAVERW